MAVLSVQPQAFKQGKIVSEGGFKLCKQTHYESKSAKDGQSTNHWLSFEVIEEGPYQGLNIPWCVNEKGLDPSMGAPGMKMLREYLNGMGHPIDETQELRLNFDAFNGNTVKIYLQPGKDNRGQSFNEISGFKPA